MGWKGMLAGSILGHFVMGPLGYVGTLIGAFVGHKVEQELFGKSRRRHPGGYGAMSSQERTRIFCASAAAMLSKLAKADGRVSEDEIASVETAFRRLGFSPSARAYAIDVFRRAKDDSHSIYEYARDFATVVDSLEVRELFYEILWDLARTDGRVTSAERTILERIPRALRIRPDWFAYFAYGRGGFRGDGGGGPSGSDDLSEAYAVLGATPADSNDALKGKYRELAKKNHPDALRAQGLPEEMVGKATERMSRINAAWEAVKRARNMS